MIFVSDEEEDDDMTRLLYAHDMMRIMYVYYNLIKLLYRACTNTAQIHRGKQICENRNLSSSAGGRLAAALDYQQCLLWRSATNS